MSNLFEKFFIESLNSESMTTASAGIGGTAGTTDSSDFYAPGDARMPHGLFGGKIFQRPKPKRKKRKSKKRRSNKK